MVTLVLRVLHLVLLVLQALQAQLVHQVHMVRRVHMVLQDLLVLRAFLAKQAPRVPRGPKVKSAQPAQPAQSAPATPAAGEPLRVGVSNVGKPFVFLENGEWKGSDIDLVRRFAAASGRPLQLVSMDFGALIASLQSGKVDIMTMSPNFTVPDPAIERAEVSDIAGLLLHVDGRLEHLVCRRDHLGVCRIGLLGDDELRKLGRKIGFRQGIFNVFTN